MRIKLGAFPISFFTATCAKHDCVVSLRLYESTDRTGQYTVGSQIVPVRCLVGGDTSDANCTDKWELSVSGTGDITITQ